MKYLFLILLGFFSLTTAYGYDLEVDGIYYNADLLKQELTVTKGDIPYSGTIQIPAQIEHKGKSLKVVKIDRYAFFRSEIVSVIIPYSIEFIGSSAFAECNKLKKVELTEGLTEIDDSAFEGCENLEEIIIPNTVIKIQEDAFSDTGIMRLIFKDGEKELNNKSLYGKTGNYRNPLNYLYLGRTMDCLSLFYKHEVATEVHIGPLVKSLPDHSLQSLTIEKLIIPKNIKIINESLPNQKAIKELIIEDSNEQLGDFESESYIRATKLYLGREMTYGYAKDVESLEIGENITQLKYFAFDFSNIKVIYNHSLVPAECGINPPYGPTFNNWTYLNSILYVPVGSLSIYKAADGWKNFYDIREFEASVDDIETDSAREPQINVIKGGLRVLTDCKIAIYSSSGQLVESGYLSSGTEIAIPAGMYIVRIGEKAKKVFVR